MFKASLFIFDKEYPLLSYELGSYQPADDEGLPNCRVVLEKISFSYQSVKDDSAFLRAAISGETMVSGYIRVYKRDGFQKFMDYEFANAYVLKFRETFNSSGEQPMTTHITLGVGILKVEAHTTETHWNPNNPYGDEGEVTTIEENEPEIVETYYTDIEGNEIPDDKLKRGQTVYFVIKTLNATGKELAIDLDNNKLDFIYNNEVLEEDILHVNISGDTMKLELKTIAEQN